MKLLIMDGKSIYKSSGQRTRVNIYEEWDVNYWLKELGCTRKELEKAVTSEGTSAEKVRSYILNLQSHM